MHTRPVPPDPLLAEVMRLTSEAAAEALRHRPGLDLRKKPDGSVVTDADRAAEETLRKGLLSLVPGTAFWGEEGGFEPSGPGGLWLVDPVDGTTNFAFGQPLWGTSVGLIVDGSIALGAMALPELGIALCARRGAGAWRDGERMAHLPAAPVEAHEPVGREEGCGIVCQGKGRHLGSFVVEAAFTSLGWLRGFCSHRARLYDAAGGLAVLREVGAEARHADGRLLDESRWALDAPIDAFAVFPAWSPLP